ncbi:DUF3509 domain-containing protein [Pseudomonas sp. PDM19]|uniref:DUF3509 domain-containing protein n=1 Tax=Pseudomonas sp. PDM19 TaxID=2769272 RepID=UPI0017838E41|nr:DUF3509 domain-containing protein [Pseudomonas sp. PDM19]
MGDPSRTDASGPPAEAQAQSESRLLAAPTYPSLKSPVVQNAMAFSPYHAGCMASEADRHCNHLIFKDFLFTPDWYAPCNEKGRNHPFIAEDDTMPIDRLPAAQYLCQAFSDFDVSFTARPDGNLIMTLSKDAGEHIACRVVRQEEQRNEELLTSLVGRIRRDLATEYGPLQERDADHFKAEVPLQNFYESAEPLRQRRIVKAGARLRSMANVSA